MTREKREARALTRTSQNIDALELRHVHRR